MENENIYQTIDLALAAYLKTQGKNIICIDHKGNSRKRKATIVFEMSEDLEEMIKKYYDNEALVDPRTFFDNVRGLKSRIVNSVRA
jgi:hypothetical protein